MKTFKRPDLAGREALILHPPNATADALVRQLALMRISARVVWPQLDLAGCRGRDFVFFDVDVGHEGQFPWEPGCAPMPTIALIGSEAPGRIEWAIAQGADAHLLKPIGSTGVYSALLVASHAFETMRQQTDDIRALEGRLRQRPSVVQAVLLLMEEGARDQERGHEDPARHCHDLADDDRGSGESHLQQ